MSFLDDIVGFAGGVVDFLGSNSIGANLAKSALLGWGVRQLQDNVTPQNVTSTNPQAADAAISPLPDKGVRLQVSPSPDQKIPVVYGTAQLGGIITDAALANSNQTLYVVFTICEVTGTKLSDSLASSISFENIFVNDQRVIFDDDDQTLSYTIDRDGNIDSNWSGLIKFYNFNNGSNNPTNGSDPAWDIMPAWSNQYTMNQLVFGIVEINYYPEKGLDKIPTIRYQVSNNMDMPGDCIFDYLTNTRYGAGIPAAEIYSA
jgi:hypothetical protein